MPSRRASHGVAARPQARPSRYPLTTQAALPSEVCSPRTMTGTATLTTEESIIESMGPARKHSRSRAGRGAVVSGGLAVAAVTAGPPVAADPALMAGPRAVMAGPSRLCGWFCRGAGRERVQPGQLVLVALDGEVHHAPPPRVRLGVRPERGEVREQGLDDLPPGADDLQPVVGVEIGKEGHPDLELVVIGDQRGVRVADHRPLLLKPAQRRVEHIVVDRPPSDDALDLLLDLIAVPLPAREHVQHQYVKVHGVKLTCVS